MKVLVSACLLGESCKYNGGNNYNGAVAEFVRDKEILPICPELMAGMGCPRTPIEIVDGVLMDRDGKNVDTAMREAVEMAMKQLDIHNAHIPNLIVHRGISFSSFVRIFPVIEELFSVFSQWYSSWGSNGGCPSDRTVVFLPGWLWAAATAPKSDPCSELLTGSTFSAAGTGKARACNPRFPSSPANPVALILSDRKAPQRGSEQFSFHPPSAKSPG